ncbi:uncharacterized protein [Spinacia oleracea]|uniref:Lipoxygenase domain-containing protein n=1 Tax=Spinacia oleracea TaxID=3562 RepID=A0ABM3R681_SPIOL|nr:uncharacterized protein LOC130466297 [Spinacia oleracea]
MDVNSSDQKSQEKWDEILQKCKEDLVKNIMEGLSPIFSLLRQELKEIKEKFTEIREEILKEEEKKVVANSEVVEVEVVEHANLQRSGSRENLPFVTGGNAEAPDAGKGASCCSFVVKDFGGRMSGGQGLGGYAGGVSDVLIRNRKKRKFERGGAGGSGSGGGPGLARQGRVSGDVGVLLDRQPVEVFEHGGPGFFNEKCNLGGGTTTCGGLEKEGGRFVKGGSGASGSGGGPGYSAGGCLEVGVAGSMTGGRRWSVKAAFQKNQGEEVYGRTTVELVVGLLKNPNVEDKGSMVKGLIDGTTGFNVFRPLATDTTKEIQENGPAYFEPKLNKLTVGLMSFRSISISNENHTSSTHSSTHNYRNQHNPIYVSCSLWYNPNPNTIPPDPYSLYTYHLNYTTHFNQNSILFHDQLMNFYFIAKLMPITLTITNEVLQNKWQQNFEDDKMQLYSMLKHLEDKLQFIQQLALSLGRKEDKDHCYRRQEVSANFYPP